MTAQPALSEPVYEVVAGDPGRNQSKGYCSNHVQGPPVSKPVLLPGNWQRLLAENP